MARVSTVINQVKISIAEARECEDVREVGIRTLSRHGLDIVTCTRLISLKTYLLRNLSVLNSVKVRFMTITLDL